MSHHEGETMRRREASGFLHVNVESADVPTHEAINMHVLMTNGKCFLVMKRRQDSVSLQLCSEAGGSLWQVMSEILDFAMSPPR